MRLDLIRVGQNELILINFYVTKMNTTLVILLHRVRFLRKTMCLMYV